MVCHSIYRLTLARETQCPDPKKLGRPLISAVQSASQFEREIRAGDVKSLTRNPAQNLLRVAQNPAALKAVTGTMDSSTGAELRGGLLYSASIKNSHSKAMIAGGSSMLSLAPRGAVRRKQLSQPSRQSNPPSSWKPTPLQRATSLGRVFFMYLQSVCREGLRTNPRVNRRKWRITTSSAEK